MHHQITFYSIIGDFDLRGFTAIHMNKIFKVYSVHKGFKVLVVYLFPSAREASEATGEEVMFHSHVWSYSHPHLPPLIE